MSLTQFGTFARFSRLIQLQQPALAARKCVDHVSELPRICCNSGNAFGGQTSRCGCYRRIRSWCSEWALAIEGSQVCCLFVAQRSNSTSGPLPRRPNILLSAQMHARAGRRWRQAKAWRGPAAVAMGPPADRVLTARSLIWPTTSTFRVGSSGLSTRRP